MAVVSSNYEFILVDIGGQGRQSDAGIFKNSLIGHKLINNTLNIPPPQIVSEGRPHLPFVIVGDEAFPLLENLMRPYPGRSDCDFEKRIYNYRHSRARRLSENVFGILVAQWRVFSKTIIGSIENIENIIKACVCLHNFLLKYAKNLYIAPTLIDNEENGEIIQGTWRTVTSNLTPLRQMGANVHRRTAGEIRDIFKEYFNEEGAVAWQWDIS